MNVKLLFFSVTNQIRTYLRSHDRMAKKLDTFFFQKKSDHFDLKRYYEHLQFKTQMPYNLFRADIRHSSYKLTVYR